MTSVEEPKLRFDVVFIDSTLEQRPHILVCRSLIRRDKKSPSETPRNVEVDNVIEAPGPASHYETVLHP